MHRKTFMKTLFYPQFVSHFVYPWQLHDRPIPRKDI